MKKSQAADDDDEDLNDTNYDEVPVSPGSEELMLPVACVPRKRKGRQRGWMYTSVSFELGARMSAIGAVLVFAS